jgi:hypothetical protein
MLGVPPGDTVGRLLAAKPSFQLYAHSVSAPPRIWVAHCPMCQVPLVDHPPFGLRCPHCAQGISYVQRTSDGFPELGELAMGRTRSFIWLPRRVGEYLKKRYERIWR